MCVCVCVCVCEVASTVHYYHNAYNIGELEEDIFDNFFS